MPSTKGDQDISEEYELLRERVQQEIRDIEKSITKLTKRKGELEELLKSPPTGPSFK